MTESIVAEERDRNEFSRTRVSLGLWFGMVGGPMCGMLMVWINYPTVDRACVDGNRIWLHAVALALLIVAIAAWFLSWHYYKKAGDFPMTEGGVMPRSRFMSLVGLFTSSLALIEIPLQWLPIFFIGSCIGT